MFESEYTQEFFFALKKKATCRNSKVTDLIRPEFKLRDFMPVLVISKFDKDPIKNECASLEKPFSHYKSMGNFLDTHEHLNPKGVVQSG